MATPRFEIDPDAFKEVFTKTLMDESTVFKRALGMPIEENTYNLTVFYPNGWVQHITRKFAGKLPLMIPIITYNPSMMVLDESNKDMPVDLVTRQAQHIAGTVYRVL